LLNKLKLDTFVLLLENGDKINKKNLHKLSSVFEGGSNEFEIAVNTAAGAGAGLSRSIQVITKAMEDKGIRSANFDTAVKDFCATYTDVRQISFQNRLIVFLNKFYNNTVKRIENKINAMTKSFDYIKGCKRELDLNFQDSINKLQELLKDVNVSLGNSDTILQLINKSHREFNKSYSTAENKLNSFNKLFTEFIKINENKLKEYIPESSITSLIHKVNLLYERLRDNPGDIIASINKLVSDDDKMAIKKALNTNTTRLRFMLDDDGDKLKKELINKLSEINLYKRHLDDNLANCLLVKDIRNNFKGIMNEVRKRKSFELVYKKVVDFVSNRLIESEERRRTE
jgi:hypothetical protein